MNSLPGSTIAVLCYARKTEFDFHGLATDMARTLWDRQGGMRLDMPDPDLAICDLSDMRIGLARIDMARDFPGSPTALHFPSCMLLSVGPGETVPAAPMAARYAGARGELVSLLQDIEAADRLLMFERAGSFDAEIHNAVVDDVRAHLDRVLMPRRTPVSDEIAPLKASAAKPPEAPLFAGADVVEGTPASEPVPGSNPGSEPRADHRPKAGPLAGPKAGPGPSPVKSAEPEDIVQGLASRVEAELNRLDRARRAFEEAEAAADRRAQQTHGMRLIVPRLLPGLPPSTLGLFRFPGQAHARGAAAAATAAYPDYNHMPANVDDRPLLHRAAVNALNVTVMAIALPVGAALLTMSVLGREDMLFSSRVTAVTGVGVGLYNTGVAESLFAFFS